jgi:hypothetical protein
VHRRSLIRKGAVAALEAESVRLKSAMKVFESRTAKEFSAFELPACTVVTPEESIDQDKFRVALEDKQRVLMLTIGVYTCAPTEQELRDLLDGMALIVESAVEKDPSLGGNATTALYAGSDCETAENGNAYRGSCFLRYQVIYQYVPEFNETDLSPLLVANAQWNLSNTQAVADRINDTITVEQAP